MKFKLIKVKAPARAQIKKYKIMVCKYEGIGSELINIILINWVNNQCNYIYTECSKNRGHGFKCG